MQHSIAQSLQILVGCKWSRLCVLRDDSGPNTADGGPLSEPPSVQAATKPITLRKCGGNRASRHALRDGCYSFLLRSKREERKTEPRQAGWVKKGLIFRVKEEERKVNSMTSFRCLYLQLVYSTRYSKLTAGLSVEKCVCMSLQVNCLSLRQTRERERE